MNRNGSRAGWQLFVGSLIVALCVAGGCGDSSGGDESPSNARDESDEESLPDVSVSESCQKACTNFMDKCGTRTPVTKSDCELDCETNWSERLTECVRAATVCGQVEGCAEEDRSAADAGPSGDTGGTAEVGEPAADAHDVRRADAGNGTVSDATD